MKVEEVRKLSPLDRLRYWVTEREAIRRKKEAGEPRPWTTDTILQSYRFCNVRRADDAVSRWLLDNWYVPNYDSPRMLVAVALARFVNLPEALAEVGFPAKRWDPERVKRILRARRERGETTFNCAYMVRGGKVGGEKIAEVVDEYVTPLHRDPPKLDHSSMEASVATLTARYGFGSFMAGQVCADMRWAVSGSWADKLTWAAIGPGSRRGMNIIQGRELGFPLKQPQFTEELGALMVTLRSTLPQEITERLEAIDYQNCLCEISGWEKVLWGRGRKKRRYPGGAP